MKTVKYFGNNIIVPDWVVYVAVDDDSQIFGFDEEPQFLPSFSRHLGAWMPTGDNFVLLGTDKTPSHELFPIDTLRKV